MSEENQENIEAVKENDAEVNLSRMRKKYERELQEEALARQKAEQRIAQLEASMQRPEAEEEEEEEDDPYIDKKKFKKTMSKFSEITEKKTQSQIQKAVNDALENERKQNYLNQHSDFNHVLTDENAEKFAERYPKLADTILKMPEGFERQKLVYENIKALGVDQKDQKKNLVQDKINQNKQHPGYQPSGSPGGAYANQGDFSASGQKNAYDKMQELKKRMRIS